ILHRDTLGSHQPIQPGDVNWMTAGSGIAHSERTDTALRTKSNRLFGIQSWVALPRAQEETAPAFVHHPATTLPVLEERGLRLRLIAGNGWGARSPVAVLSPLFYADVTLQPGAAVTLPAEHEERAAYVLQGAVDVAGTRAEAGRLLIFRPGDQLALRSPETDSRLLLLGGAPMDGKRHASARSPATTWSTSRCRRLSACRRSIRQGPEAPRSRFQKIPAAMPAASAAPTSSQRRRSSGPIVLGARIRSRVWACVHTITGSATARSRQPTAMRVIWRTAFVPSLPAQISIA